MKYRIVRTSVSDGPPHPDAVDCGSIDFHDPDDDSWWVIDVDDLKAFIEKLNERVIVFPPGKYVDGLFNIEGDTVDRTLWTLEIYDTYRE